MSNNKKRKKTFNYKKYAVRIVLFLVVILVFVSGWLYLYLAGFNNSAVKLSSSLSSDDVKIQSDSKSSNILVMGVDIGTTGSTNANDPKRTDTMILVHYNAVDKKVSLISIPRDTLAVVNDRNQKINAAHAIGGVDYAVAAVEKLVGVKIDYYAKINYKGFDELIDAIGGVDINVTRKMDYDDPTQDLSIHFEKGLVHMDGKKAEEFFRWRKNSDGSGLANGDLGRIENQHIFIAKVMEKVKSPFIIFKIPSVLTAVKNAIETNMDANEILKFGFIFATIDNDKLSMETLNGVEKYVNGVSYVVYDEDLNKEVISELSDNKAPIVNKSKLKIKVINGTQKTGLAKDFSTYLTEKGYNEAKTETGEATSKSKITVYNGSKDMKADLQTDFKIDNIEFLSSSNKSFDIVVTLGDDHELMH
ncbi:LCP family protein [Clostridium frigoris]|uniref:LCP family protein n=1 Tax=Clostridium frigoris TaxID=205327 RepID=A0ABS6BUV4_9CLOT|nr:LCP family protein [Clostridium frigoris]MBU3160124.1 LCP family protein [Clostridium frigoris]